VALHLVAPLGLLSLATSSLWLKSQCFAASRLRSGLRPLPARCKEERIGRSRAARYAMLCEPMSGATAGQFGIATSVLPADEVEAAALKFAQDLSIGPTRSYAAIRTLLKAWSGGGVPSADSMILDVTMALHGSEDARRGRTAGADAIKMGIEPSKIVFTGR